MPMVERLVDSCRQHGGALADAEQAIRGFDLLEHNAEFTRKAVAAKLLESGETVEVAEFLSGKWITTGDFLLTPHHGRSADFVIGNPPYIRLEDVPNDISDAYRAEYASMPGRADIHVGFYEKGLDLLRPEGKWPSFAPPVACAIGTPVDAEAFEAIDLVLRSRPLAVRITPPT